MRIKKEAKWLISPMNRKIFISLTLTLIKTRRDEIRYLNYHVIKAGFGYKLSVRIIYCAQLQESKLQITTTFFRQTKKDTRLK